jgi:hypothetical protein
MTALFLESNMSNDGDWYLLIGLLQFFVGLAQIIGAIFRTIVSLFDKTDCQKLGIYWAMVLVYFSIWELFLYNHWNIVIWIPFAWLIAIWYCMKIVFPRVDSVNTSIDIK